MIQKAIIIFVSLCLLVCTFFSFFPISTTTQGKIYTGLALPPKERTLCLPGARVYNNGRLSPVLKERCDALILYYHEKADMVSQVIVSGDGPEEVDPIAGYLSSQKIPERKLFLDYKGKNTGKNVAHCGEIALSPLLFVSQSFHAKRILKMAESRGLKADILAAEKVVKKKNSSFSSHRCIICIKRYYRESLLLFLQELGLYNTIAELIGT